MEHLTNEEAKNLHRIPLEITVEELRRPAGYVGDVVMACKCGGEVRSEGYLRFQIKGGLRFVGVHCRQCCTTYTIEMTLPPEQAAP